MPRTLARLFWESCNETYQFESISLGMLKPTEVTKVREMRRAPMLKRKVAVVMLGVTGLAGLAGRMQKKRREG